MIDIGLAAFLVTMGLLSGLCFLCAGICIGRGMDKGEEKDDEGN